MSPTAKAAELVGPMMRMQNPAMIITDPGRRMARATRLCCLDILAAVTFARRDPSSIVEAATMPPNIPSKGEPT